MKVKNQKRINTVVGLTLDNGHLEFAWLRRTNGSVEIKAVGRIPLTLDLMRNEPDLVGQEIRNMLTEANVRERNCVVGLPSEWILSTRSELPDLAEEDIESFLELEAEQNFPTNRDQLQVATSIQNTALTRYATQLAVTSNQIVHLEEILSAAQLKPVQLSPSIAALPEAIPSEGNGTISVVVSEDRIGLLVAAGGGIVTIRSLDNAIDTEGTERRVSSNVVARELRITLGRLPNQLKSNITELRVFGTERVAKTLISDLEPTLSPLGISASHVDQLTPSLHGLQVKGDTAVSGALGLAAQFLSDGDRGIDFLPPKPTIWQQLSERYAGKKLAYGGSIAAAAAIIVCGMFAYQQYQLSTLRADWDGMKDRVYELEDMQHQIRAFRPWYDQSPTSLHVLHSVTEAFPDAGSVTARTLDIRDQSAVTVTGVADDNTDFLNMLDRLREQRSIAQLNVDQMRGSSPLQFSFNFDWQEGGQ